MKRIVELDVLRGFALLGILWANVMWFSGFAVASTVPSRIDDAVTFALTVLVAGKFYSLFSLLFGVGFALSARAREPGGAKDESAFRRRLVLLAGVGAVHAVFIWFGDIVSLYAVCGIALLFVDQWSVRRLVVTATLCLIAPIAIGGALLAASALGGVTTGSGYGPASLLPEFATGTYERVLSANWEFLVERWTLALLSSRFFRILGMFLLGVAVVRSGVLRDRQFLVRVVRVTLPVAVVSNIVLGLCGGVRPARPPTLPGWLIDVVSSVAVPTGGLFYAASCLLIGRRFHWLAPAGRLSLTNYVGQSLVMAWLFYGYGFAQWGQVGAAAALAIATAIFVGQLALSTWWLRHFRQGPLEWIVRR